MTGLQATTYVDASGIGLVYNVSAAEGRLLLNGDGKHALSTNPQRYSKLDQATRFGVTLKATSQDWGNPNDGQVYVYNTSSDGNHTLLGISANNEGVPYFCLNPNQSSGILTVTSAGETINRHTGVTSFQVFPGEMAIAVPVYRGGTNPYWGVSIVPMENGTQARKTTVANLPAAAAANEGNIRYVTDATAPIAGATVVGGGSAKAAVMSNASNWIVIVAL